MHVQVFQPIIGEDLKLSAEDVETAIIEQNSALAKLHTALLKVSFASHKYYELVNYRNCSKYTGLFVFVNLIRSFNKLLK